MQHRFVFICGLNRSGTSLLHRLLRQHPDISGFANTGALEDEGQHLQTVYPIAKEAGGAGRFCFYKKSFLNETSPLITEANRNKLFNEWSRYWDTSKPVLVEKSPPNIIRSRFLQAMFPESTFIFILRHPLAVSFATQKWAKTKIIDLVEHWCIAHQTMQQDMQHLRQSTLLRYEDLVAQPEATMKLLYDVLQLPGCPIEEPVKQRINAAYFRKWEAHLAQRPAARTNLQPFAALPAQYGYHFDAPYVI